MRHKNEINWKNRLFRGLSLAVAAALTAAALAACSGKPAAKTAAGPDVTIDKGGVTATAKFIPYDAGGTKMELIAVKAPDGTVRTALNTCQVCYDSGRGYYVQQGDELVCQNCGNRFSIAQIEKQKNGCNPVPILEGEKADDGATVTIPGATLAKYAPYFADWKR